MWGRGVINATADRLERAVSGGSRGNESRLPEYEALYVHFIDAKVPQQLAVWLYATTTGAPYNVSGYQDVIGAGLKHDSDRELHRGEWRFRPLHPFAWRTHVDKRWEGFRWLRNVEDLPEDAQSAADEISECILSALRRASAV